MTDAPFPALAALSRDLVQAVAAAAPGVVGVCSRRTLSSGWAWRPDRVVAAEEALAEDGPVTLTLPGGETRVATVAGRDPGTGVALLRADGAGLTPGPAGGEPAAPGAAALVVGARDGAPLAAFGVVAATGPAWRSLRGGRIDQRIELALRLPRQAEGGLVLDPAGRAMGMALRGPRRRVLVIPAATIDRVAAQLDGAGRVPRAYLGLALYPVRLDDDDRGGAMVMAVDAAGPGAAAGIRQGDILVGWNGEAVTAPARLLRLLGPDSVGTTVAVGLVRGGAALETRLTVGERGAGHGAR